MRKLMERRFEQARTPIEDRVFVFRDGIVSYFSSRGSQFRAVPLTVIHPLNVRIEISRVHTGSSLSSAGNEFNVREKGRGDVTYRVVLEEGKEEEEKGRVRVSFNQILSRPIEGSPDELKRAEEVYGEVRRYLSGHADYVGPHVAKDGTPQERYLMRD